MIDRRARVAPQAVTSGDVTRPRRTWAVALASAAGAATYVVASWGGAHEAQPGARAIGRPHTLAAVTCADCHAAGKEPAFEARGACVACHGTALHAPRPAHARALADGRMTCGTCHSAHAPRGVTFERGVAMAWGAGPRATAIAGSSAQGVPDGVSVPTVTLAACAACHEPASPSDPIARCVTATVRAELVRAQARDLVLARSPSACLDEHAAELEGKPPAIGSVACAPQHAASRRVAHDAARVLTAETSVSAARDGGSSPPLPAAAGAAATLAVGLVMLARRRREPSHPVPSAAAPPRATGRRKLPVVDPSTCLGCRACVDACPFDVLAVERYVAVVARPEECCGVVLCAQVCPNGSLTIAGDERAPAPTALPLRDDLGSVNVPGVWVAGDLTGLPLVKNAIRQGVQVVDAIAEGLPRRPDPHAPADVDVLVVGAGPAGLSAALRAREKGLSCAVVEQATVAASIKSFPRDKIVHDPPLHLPAVGELWLRECTKEELVAQWDRIVRTRGLDVREGHRLVDLERGPVLVAHLEAHGERRTLRARRVVLAIGRRGTPRKLEGFVVSPRAEAHVFASLADAASFGGKRVLVVGLGDAALEAIVALARQPGTVVEVSYRGTTFARGKARNVDEVRALVERGRVRLHFGTVPRAFDGRAVELVSSDVATVRGASVRADAVLALLGGEPAWALLERLGVASSNEGKDRT